MIYYKEGEASMTIDTVTLERLCQLRFTTKQLRSRPHISGFWWVDIENNGQWEVVRVYAGDDRHEMYDVEFKRIGSVIIYDAAGDVKGKWVGPMLPRWFPQ